MIVEIFIKTDNGDISEKLEIPERRFKKLCSFIEDSKPKPPKVEIKKINNKNLLDYPDNEENIMDTADLELSMTELGFTDPLEVTSFDMESGKFMILSGHRRRAAAVKLGIETFPCIIKDFNSGSEVKNYVLMANSHRDSSKDFLLLSSRYLMHEDYLRSIGFKGSVREEIAKRLGVSVQQADRYKQMSRIISPIMEMVKNEQVGMSSILPLASHTIDEQEEILVIFNRILAEERNLTRELCNSIIASYRTGKKKFKNRKNSLEYLDFDFEDFDSDAPKKILSKSEFITKMLDDLGVRECV